MRNILTGILFIALLALGLWHFESLRQRVDREACNQASMRLLAEFHAEYLARNGVSLDDYRNELKMFGERHKGLDELQGYVKEVRKKE